MLTFVLILTVVGILCSIGFFLIPSPPLAAMLFMAVVWIGGLDGILILFWGLHTLIAHTHLHFT
jgi:hypothetical protein